MSTSSLRSSSFAIGSNVMRQEAPGLFALALLSPINKTRRPAPWRGPATLSRGLRRRVLAPLRHPGGPAEPGQLLHPPGERAHPAPFHVQPLWAQSWSPRPWSAGGIGKTALALEYVHRLFSGEHAADQVWWFGAADRLSLTAAMGALYEQLTALRPGRTAWSGRSGCAAGSRPAPTAGSWCSTTRMMRGSSTASFPGKSSAPLLGGPRRDGVPGELLPDAAIARSSSARTVVMASASPAPTASPLIASLSVTPQGDQRMA